MVDNDPEDRYFYLITVYTSMRGNAGTQSKIGFTLVGEDGDTGIRMMADGMRKVEYHCFCLSG